MGTGRGGASHFARGTDVSLWGAWAKFRGIIERIMGTLSEKKLIEMLMEIQSDIRQIK
jgi:hypothetical protein